MVIGRLTFATILVSVPTLDDKEIGRQTKQVTLEREEPRRFRIPAVH